MSFFRYSSIITSALTGVGFLIKISSASMYHETGTWGWGRVLAEDAPYQVNAESVWTTGRSLLVSRFLMAGGNAAESDPRRAGHPDFQFAEPSWSGNWSGFDWVQASGQKGYDHWRQSLSGTADSDHGRGSSGGGGVNFDLPPFFTGLGGGSGGWTVPGRPADEERAEIIERMREGHPPHPPHPSHPHPPHPQSPPVPVPPTVWLLGSGVLGLLGLKRRQARKN